MRSIVSGVVGLLFLGAGWLAAADEPAADAAAETRAAAAVALERPARGTPRAKISQLLRREFARPAGSPRSVLLADAAGARVEMRLDTATDAATLAAIAATGAEVRRVSTRWNEVEILATAAQAEALAALPAVAGIRPALRPVTRATQPGTYTNQAAAVLGTDTVRDTAGVDGSGITLGILSDSINLSADVGSGTVTGTVPNAVLTGTTPQKADNLPASIRVIDFGSAATSGDSDEGAAMMELAYHLAPGASYAFSSVGGSQSTFASNILQLRSAGYKIVCDDIIFFDEPMFQDGPAAQAADAVVAGGGMYLSAAGNDADKGILSTYSDVSTTTDPHPSGVLPTGSDFHDWGIGGSTPGFLPITVTPSGAAGQITVVLQWNQPYRSFGLGAGSASDYDLYLFSSAATPTTGTLLDYSTEPQGTSTTPSGNPFEFVSSIVTSARTVYLALDRYNAETIATTFRVVIYTSGCSISLPSGTSGYPASTIYGHCAAAGALAIGAVDYHSPGTPEDFTSLGGWGSTGLPIYFSTSGSALSGAPVRRNKPELCAPDGTTTSLSTFATFYGTSAATPHAAAAMALLWQAMPTLSASELISRVEDTATDIVTSPASTGADAWTGYGLIAAAEALTPAPSCTLTASAAAVVGTPLSVTATFSEAVTGLTVSDFTITGGTLTALSGSGASYTLTISPTAAGTLSIALAAGAGTTSTGVASRGTALALTVAAAGGTGPICALSTQGSASVGTALSVTATFSGAVSGFTSDDLIVSGGTVTAFSGSGASYTLTVVPAIGGTLTIAVAAGAATGDSDSLPSQATLLSLSVSGFSHPTCTLSSSTSTPAAGQEVTITVTFSAPVTGFTASDVAVTNGSLNSFSGSDSAYTLTVSPIGGTLVVSIPTGAATAVADGGTAFGSSLTLSVTGGLTSITSTAANATGGPCGLGGGLALWGLLAVAAATRFARQRRSLQTPR
jgi:hypothetical protein